MALHQAVLKVKKANKHFCLVAQVGGGARLKRQRSEGSGSFGVEAARSKAEQDREKNELVKEESRCCNRV